MPTKMNKLVQERVMKDETPRPHIGQKVTWLQQRTWGGKQNVPAKYLHGVGRNSARIEIEGGDEKTVRLTSLRFEVNSNEG